MICSIEGCEKPVRSMGWCGAHHVRYHRTGSPTGSNPRKPRLRRSHPMYGAYAQMINRCHNPNNSSYGRYGAKGITVCDHWRADFLNFLADVGDRPDGMTLDRIDGTRGYEPDNCRWATAKEQRANITPEGDARTRKAMSEGVKKRWAKWREAKAAGALELGGSEARMKVVR